MHYIGPRPIGQTAGMDSMHLEPVQDVWQPSQNRRAIAGAGMLAASIP
jgi:hypothetical protein